MEQNKEQKWYPVKISTHSPMWIISDVPGEVESDVIVGHDMLDSTCVGPEQAEYNAYLAASAPEWKKVATVMYEWFKGAYNNGGGPYIHGIMEQYEQLIQEENGL